MGLRQCGLIEMLKLVLNHWSIEDTLQHVGDRSSDEDIHSLVWKGIFSRAVHALAMQNCAVCPLETIAYLYGGTL